MREEVALKINLPESRVQVNKKKFTLLIPFHFKYVFEIVIQSVSAITKIKLSYREATLKKSKKKKRKVRRATFINIQVLRAHMSCIINILRDTSGQKNGK